MRGASGVSMIIQNKKNSNVSNLKYNRTIADDFIRAFFNFNEMIEYDRVGSTLLASLNLNSPTVFDKRLISYSLNRFIYQMI